MFQPQVLKIDMALTRRIDSDHVRQAIVEAIVLVSQRLNITVIAEGVESEEECETLLQMGISLMQGYLFAEPAIGVLPAMAGRSMPAIDQT